MGYFNLHLVMWVTILTIYSSDCISISFLMFISSDLFFWLIYKVHMYMLWHGNKKYFKLLKYLWSKQTIMYIIILITLKWATQQVTFLVFADVKIGILIYNTPQVITLCCVHSYIVLIYVCYHYDMHCKN